MPLMSNVRPLMETSSKRVLWLGGWIVGLLCLAIAAVDLIQQLEQPEALELALPCSLLFLGGGFIGMTMLFASAGGNQSAECGRDSSSFGPGGDADVGADPS